MLILLLHELCLASGLRLLHCAGAEESDEEDEGEDSGEEGPLSSRQAPQESLVVEGGRTRRRALFAEGPSAPADAGEAFATHWAETAL